VAIVGVREKRVIFKPVRKYGSILMGDINKIKKLTASITDLDTSLANMNRDDFPHFSKGKAAQN
jgi:hypothetical protein